MRHLGCSEIVTVKINEIEMDVHPTLNGLHGLKRGKQSQHRVGLLKNPRQNFPGFVFFFFSIFLWENFDIFLVFKLPPFPAISRERTKDQTNKTKMDAH